MDKIIEKNEKKLHDLFPNFDRHQINVIYKEDDYNFQKTKDSLHELETTYINIPQQTPKICKNDIDKLKEDFAEFHKSLIEKVYLVHNKHYGATYDVLEDFQEDRSMLGSFIETFKTDNKKK